MLDLLVSLLDLLLQKLQLSLVAGLASLQLEHVALLEQLDLVVVSL